MTTLGDIFRVYGPAYRQHFADHLSPQQRATMIALEACRTETLGGHVFTCPTCGFVRYSYHACRNRHCPACQHDTMERWLDQQRTCLLPVSYFLVTFTLPANFRTVARTHQRQVYSAFFRASAAALQQLAADPRHLGGQLGMLGVLQTWTRDLRYHPHIHYLVPGVGVAPTGAVVLPPAPDFLVPVRPLARLFRGKLRASLCQMMLYHELPAAVWQQDWVVDCRPVGTGEAVLKYLAPYIFRVALSNNRILHAEDDQVTFRYTHGQSRETRTSTLPVQEFIQRFLQHVLPKGFVKVRYYGWFSAGNRSLFKRVHAQLTLLRRIEQLTPREEVHPCDMGSCPVLRCPACGTLMHARLLSPVWARAPPCPSTTTRIGTTVSMG